MLLMLFVACSGPDPERRDCSEPETGARVTLTAPNPSAPLAYELQIQAGDPVAVNVAWTDGEHAASLAYESASEHTHTVVGWRAGHTYDVDVTLTPASGRDRVERCTVQAAALPAHFPVAEIVAVQPERRAPGDTLISMRVAASNAQQDALSPYHELAVVYDEGGSVVWWMAVDALMQEVHETDTGLLVLAGAGPGAWVARYGWDGEVRQRYTIGNLPEAIGVRTTWGGGFHHDVVEVPDAPGHLLAIARASESVAQYPTSYEDGVCPPLPVGQRGVGGVAVDYLVEFDADGTVVDEVSVDALVPTDRIGCSSLGRVRPEGWSDWAHANAVVLDGSDVVLSMRNQDALVAYERGSNQVQWILGHPGGWPPDLQAVSLAPVDPEMRWFWHAHAPMFGPDLPDGRRQLVLFDNGSFGARPPDTCCDEADEPGRSRVVGYRIDEAARTVEEAFSFDTVAGGAFFCRAVGDADYLPGGTVLSTWGWVTTLPTGQPNAGAGLGATSVRIVEFDPEDLEEVWHLYLSTAASANPYGWTAYRADRIESIAGRALD